MKKLTTFLLISLPYLAISQHIGNKNIETNTYDFGTIQSVLVKINADIRINAGSSKDEVRIMVDSNLKEFMEVSLDESGRMTLQQTEWIQPSQPITIEITASKLNRFQQENYGTTFIRNIQGAEFRAMAIVGRVELLGSINTLHASGEIGIIDALDLDVDKANINLWGRGEVLLKSPMEISGIVEKDALVTYRSGEPKVRTKGRGEVRLANKESESVDDSRRFISFRLKNNSDNRINCYVVGIKPDG